MSVERTIRYDLIARLCPNATGAELRSVCTEAGMFAISARRKVATEKDFLDSVESELFGFLLFFLLGFSSSSSSSRSSAFVRPVKTTVELTDHILSSLLPPSQRSFAVEASSRRRSSFFSFFLSSFSFSPY
jgi:SpoVK/Ycf46/Vps4 family AAA+-type ATPase